MSQPGANKFVVFLIGLALGGGAGYLISSNLSGDEALTPPAKYEIDLGTVDDKEVLQDYLFMSASSEENCASMEVLAAELGVSVKDLCLSAENYSAAVARTGRRCPPPVIGCNSPQDTSQRGPDDSLLLKKGIVPEGTVIEYFNAAEYMSTLASAKAAEGDMSNITYSLTALPSGMLLASSELNGNKIYNKDNGTIYLALGEFSDPAYSGLVRLSLSYTKDDKIIYDINKVYGVTK